VGIARTRTPASRYPGAGRRVEFTPHTSSNAAQREVEERFPAWHAERDYFRAEGRGLKATMRSLLGGYR
jgi:hypothetical protein